jgi:hypothetical protein
MLAHSRTLARRMARMTHELEGLDMKRTTTENQLTTQLDQFDMLLMARATLLASIDCNDRYMLAEQCRAYLADYRAAMRLVRKYDRTPSV